jgi:hypothetical protein
MFRIVEAVPHINEAESGQSWGTQIAALEDLFDLPEERGGFRRRRRG